MLRQHHGSRPALHPLRLDLPAVFRCHACEGRGRVNVNFRACVKEQPVTRLAAMAREVQSEKKNGHLDSKQCR